ncbi:MAG: zincin-like metallopeptidase domain-containing protein [Acidiphilium sp.]|nr:zincin-like metallopeptidase domain-containing protein [Acidiphilium sp.]MDD4936889.1 zincin-like metallopeptidase domain-containing protein [Acidiphilium sp.]
MNKSKWQRSGKANANSNPNPRDIYQEVTDKIVAALERGVLPWQRGWDQGIAGAPMNPTTGRIYRGINNLLLGMMQDAAFNGDPRWCSYRQAQARDWQVRKGERGTTVVFYRKLQRRGAEGADASVVSSEGEGARPFFVLRASTVFHATQIERIPVYNPPGIAAEPWRTPEAVQTILDNSGATIHYGGARACFVPSRDCIHLPPKGAFRSDAAFAYTALHELSHYAYAAPRLNLSQGGRFGSAAYAFEELVVSIASVNICTVVGVEAEIENTTSYLADWMTVLKSDPRAIFRAASDAQRVADYVLGFHPDYAAAVQTGAAVGAGEQDDDGDPGDPLDDVGGQAAPLATAA